MLIYLSIGVLLQIIVTTINMRLYDLHFKDFDNVDWLVFVICGICDILAWPICRIIDIINYIKMYKSR